MIHGITHPQPTGKKNAEELMEPENTGQHSSIQKDIVKVKKIEEPSDDPNKYDDLDINLNDYGLSKMPVQLTDELEFQNEVLVSSDIERLNELQQIKKNQTVKKEKQIKILSDIKLSLPKIQSKTKNYFNRAEEILKILEEE